MRTFHVGPEHDLVQYRRERKTTWEKMAERVRNFGWDGMSACYLRQLAFGHRKTSLDNCDLIARALKLDSDAAVRMARFERKVVA